VIKAVLFDIDGTLLDSVDLHAESWVQTFAHFGILADFREVRSHIGEGADRLLPAFLPKGASKARKKEIEDYRSHLLKNGFSPDDRHVIKLYAEGLDRATAQWRQDIEQLAPDHILELMDLPLRGGQSEANYFVPKALAAARDSRV